MCRADESNYKGSEVGELWLGRSVYPQQMMEGRGGGDGGGVFHGALCGVEGLWLFTPTEMEALKHMI